MNISFEDTKLTNREGSSDRGEKGTEFEKIGDEENVQNYIYIYIYNDMTYLCTTGWTLKKLYSDVRLCPLPHGLLIKDDSMRKWSKKHKNYIQLQMRVKEFGGQGDWGSCALHSFLTNLCLRYLNDGRRPEQWPARRRAYLHVCSLTHIHRLARQSKGTLGSVKGRETAPTCSSDQSSLWPSLLMTSRWHSVRSRPNS